MAFSDTLLAPELPYQVMLKEDEMRHNFFPNVLRALALSGVLLLWVGALAWAASEAPAQVEPKAMDLLDRGEFAAATGRFGQAQALWNQALEVKPGWSTARRRLAELPQRRLRFPGEEAERARKSAARLAYVEAITAFNHGDYRGSAEILEGVAAVFPQDGQVLGLLDLARGMAKGMGQGSLQVESAQQAQVKLDGRPVGMTPLRLEVVPVGRHRLEVEAFGGSEVKDIEIRPRTHSEVRLTVQGGGMLVTCSPRAQIFLDGRPMGESPLELLNLALGPHRLEVRAPGYETQGREVVLRAGEKPELEFTLTPR
jgi:hypothetical protein